MNTKREQFEAFYSTRFAGGCLGNIPKRPDGEYFSAQAQIAWLTWAAAVATNASVSDTAPIAQVTIGEDGNIVKSMLYAPGLPEGEHDLWPCPVAAPEVKDYEEVLADHRRLVRELDVAMNGAGAAQQASLCDIVAQVQAAKRKARLRPLAEWDEGDGHVVWWRFEPGANQPLGEPAYIGHPNCDDWTDYYTHWTPHPDLPKLYAERRWTP